mmetsp:Transcript_32995/g.78158  ORF Transcript_32995/g.78158 Transcript_32995/m.78158 type:complete len:246 (-) Transcript_32995:3780-4517(-)
MFVRGRAMMLASTKSAASIARTPRLRWSAGGSSASGAPRKIPTAKTHLHPPSLSKPFRSRAMRASKSQRGSPPHQPTPPPTSPRAKGDRACSARPSHAALSGARCRRCPTPARLKRQRRGASRTATSLDSNATPATPPRFCPAAGQAAPTQHTHSATAGLSSGAPPATPPPSSAHPTPPRARCRCVSRRRARCCLRWITPTLLSRRPKSRQGHIRTPTAPPRETSPSNASRVSVLGPPQRFRSLR